MKKFCFLGLALLSSSAFATIDRTHVYITNNTAQSITLTPSLETTDTNFKQGSGWQGSLTTLSPYETKEVFWFLRNLGLKQHQTYLFHCQATGDALKQTLDFRFNVVAKSVFGSTVKASWRDDHQTTDWLSDNTVNQVDIESGQLYAKAWHPATQFFDNYQIVIDQPVAALVEQPAREHLKMITYNTQMMPSIAGVVDHLNQPKQRVKDIPGTMKDADVVVMEELFDPGLRETMLELMTREYPYNTLVVGDDSHKMLTGGVIIFSRWPIEVEDQIVFREGSGMDDLAAKGVSYARINKNGFIFHVFGTHLQSGDDAYAIRQQQLSEMKSFIQSKNINGNAPVILAGDFNIIKNSAEENYLTAMLNVKEDENIGFPYSVDSQTNSMNVGKSRDKIDYIFAELNHLQPVKAYTRVWINRAFTDATMWPQFDLSDHYPVTSDFYF